MCVVLAVKNQRWLPKLFSFSRPVTSAKLFALSCPRGLLLLHMVSPGSISQGACSMLTTRDKSIPSHLSQRDVGYETYKAYRQGPSTIEAACFSEPSRLALSAAQRATFQSIASM